MKPANLLKFIKPKGKFFPFEIHTSNGGSFRVPSPEFVWMPQGADLVVIYEQGEGVTIIDTDEVTECHRAIKKKGQGPG
jgi:hypothetical protein